jgi:hypothetical protein
MRLFVNRKIRLAQVFFRQREDEWGVLVAAPGTPLKRLEKLEHSLPPSFPTEQGHWVDLLGVGALHGWRICIHCATSWKRSFTLIHSGYGEFRGFGTHVSLGIFPKS